MTAAPKFISAVERARWLEAQIECRIAQLELMAARTAVDYARSQPKKTIAEQFDAVLRKRGWRLDRDGGMRRLDDE